MKEKIHQEVAQAERRILGKKHCSNCNSFRPGEGFTSKTVNNRVYWKCLECTNFRKGLR